jgi:hypothetical protein
MKTLENAAGKEIQFHAGDVLKCVLRGAPFVWRIKQPWQFVRVPRFPVAFSVLSGILWWVMTELKVMHAVREAPPPKRFGLPFAVSLLADSAFFVVMNAVIMGVFWIILKQFNNRSIKNSGGTWLAGARRVSYFSTVFQPLFFLILAAPFFAQSYVTSPAWAEHAFLVGLVCAAIIRLAAAFQSMRHETGGSILAGLLASVFCLDLWGSFVPIVFG